MEYFHFAKFFTFIFCENFWSFYFYLLLPLGIGVAVAAAGTHYVCSQLNQPFQETFSCCSGDKSSPGCQVGAEQMLYVGMFAKISISDP
jgi:hypothetical protein